MSNIPRRSIEELLSRYDMEPTLKDMYVEGVFDKEILSQIKTKHQDTIIYEIDTVDVPAQILEKLGLTSGNKQRVIALASELAQIQGRPNYICLVDKDMDHWLDEIQQIPRLKWTEYTSIELYFFSKDVIDQVITVLGRAKIHDSHAYLESITEALKSIYALRLTDRSLKLSLLHLELNKHLKITNGLVSFDSAEYSRRWLAKSNKLSVLKEFISTSQTWREKLNEDPRICIRGHDFIDLLAWSIKALKGIPEMASSVAVERLMLAVVDKAPDLHSLFES